MSAVTLFTYTMVFLHVHENYEKHLQRTLDQAINELLGLGMSYFLWFPREVWGTRYPQCDQWSGTCLTPWRIRPETAPKPARTAVAGRTTYPSKGDSDRERHSNIAEREDKNMTVKQAQEQLPDKLIANIQTSSCLQFTLLCYFLTTGERATKAGPGSEPCICCSIQAENKTQD
ncbi:uncharacterized protein LOC121073233 isoform X2 [Cygnus olor]|uniref:uncharacterized protein LOC121073233 isoform X2 n=1 Tax=Cygnus olor TaxID=8869 RepID=UPI001ADE3144|nr:uncharacterized protein LOC121073233 isoform X2 [Cygnus olor]